jgi:signal transduction histidine kinase
MNPVARPETGGNPERTLLRGTLHKTSNSLCGIKGYASLLADPERGGEDPGRWARKILDEIARLEDIFRSVASLTPERGSPDVGVDAAVLVADTARAAAAAHPNLEVTLEGLPTAEVLLPMADFRLVLGEILGNAAEAGDRVLVRITAETAPDGGVTLCVADDGGGWEPGVADRAAQPFVTTKEGHLGVGLTRVATLMEMYGLAWSLRTNDMGGLTARLHLAAVTA